MKIRRYYKFTGMVQGVGFRFRAMSAARMYGVTGWVRNCSDGSVEMEAEGRKNDIDEVILAIERGSFVHIDNMEVREIPLQGGYDFTAR